MKFTILVDPSLVIITIYLVCLIYAFEERRRFLKGIMHFHYMTYMATPCKNPCPGGHEIYNLSRPFLGHHYFTLVLSETCPWVDKKIFFRNTSILHLLPQNNLPFGWRSWNLQFLSPYPTDATYQCWLR